MKGTARIHTHGMGPSIHSVRRASLAKRGNVKIPSSKRKLRSQANEEANVVSFDKEWDRTHSRNPQIPTHEKKWIQKAVNPKHEGALREEVKERFGKKGFTEEGTIKKAVLVDLSHDTSKLTGHTTKTAERARFALNVRESKTEADSEMKWGVWSDRTNQFLHISDTKASAEAWAKKFAPTWAEVFPTKPSPYGSNMAFPHSWTKVSPERTDKEKALLTHISDLRKQQEKGASVQILIAKDKLELEHEYQREIARANTRQDVAGIKARALLVLDKDQGHSLKMFAAAQNRLIKKNAAGYKEAVEHQHDQDRQPIPATRDFGDGKVFRDPSFHNTRREALYVAQKFRQDEHGQARVMKDKNILGETKWVVYRRGGPSDALREAGLLKDGSKESSMTLQETYAKKMDNAQTREEMIGILTKAKDDLSLDQMKVLVGAGQAQIHRLQRSGHVIGDLDHAEISDKAKEQLGITGWAKTTPLTHEEARRFRWSLAFIEGLKPGDIVEARFTNIAGWHSFPARIVRVNEKSVVVVRSDGKPAWAGDDPNREFNIPKLGTQYNGVFPFNEENRRFFTEPVETRSLEERHREEQADQYREGQEDIG
jgi:hypothetical protein